MSINTAYDWQSERKKMNSRLLYCQKVEVEAETMNVLFNSHYVPIFIKKGTIFSLNVFT